MSCKKVLCFFLLAMFLGLFSLPCDETSAVSSSPLPFFAFPFQIRGGNSLYAEELHPLPAPEDAEGTSPTPLPIGKTIFSLLIVVGVLVVFLTILRRWIPKTNLSSPSELYQVISVFPLTARVQGRIVRFGSSLLLLAVSRDSVTTLATLPESSLTEADQAVLRTKKEEGEK